MRPYTAGSNGSIPRSIPKSTPPSTDMNRPLPPAPSSSVDNYDIPTLRRKPPIDQSDSSSQKHARSFSHPFPSLFGSRRTDKKSATRHGGKSSGQDDGEEWEDNVVSAKSGMATTSSSVTGRTDRQPITGKCMTCDCTVRWPHGLKVFRCTTCLTVNDLEPYAEPQKEASGRPGTASIPHPRRTPRVVSFERTKEIIERCLTRYLEAQLSGNPSFTKPIQPFTDTSSFTVSEARGSTPDVQLNNVESPPPSPLPPLKPRAPSEPQLRSVAPVRHESGAGAAFSSEDPFHLREVSSPYNHANPSVQAGQSVSLASDGPDSIFREVENYIGACFSGCAVLNSSFFTIKPLQGVRTPTSSDPRKRQAPEPPLTPSFVPEDYMSEMDAKTLLLGDVAENGFWWTGGRAANSERENRQRDRSPDVWKGVVSMRTPRINWIELAEWYRLVTHAGENWRRRWGELRSNTNESKEGLWESISLDRLHQEISESQVHLQRSLLKSTENLLKRPRRPMKHAEDCRFLLMILSNPLLHPSSTVPASAGGSSAAPHTRMNTEVLHRTPSKRLAGAFRKAGNLGHHSGIVKRILGLLANLPNEIHAFLVSWFSRFADNQFQKTVELIGGFTTYRLMRQQRKPVQETINPTEGLVPSFSDGGVRHLSQIHAALEMRPSSNSTKSTDGKPKLASYGEDWQIRAAARVMALLFQANTGHTSRKRDLAISTEQRLSSAGLNAKYQAYSHGQILPVSNFYNSLLDYADLVADFEAWETTKTKFTFCQYPFFLSIYAKIHVLEHDAKRQMEVKAREAFFDSILSRKAVSQYLVLKVRRDCLVEDSLKNVSEVVGAGAGDIKKGLRIDFVGEEGIDAGGLRKEWFLLLVREIFDPNHGLFVFDEDSQYCYFNPFCFESSEQFFLVGVLLGLAIYNSTILDIAFPPFVFKKMLASAPSVGDKLTSTPKISHNYSLEDLAELRPALAKGLRQLLDFEGDVQETFCRDFVIETDRYGEMVRVPLLPGGEKREVTNSNRREFVDLYIHYLLDTAVARQYEPFKRGFFTVCGGNALSLFRPEEIELLVRGSDEPLDINSLRAVAMYEGWPKAAGPPEQQRQVIWFWDFFQRVTAKDQRKILSFITASDRIPAMGATNLVIKVVLLKDKDTENGGSRKAIERFPIARTCFNTLGLYQYNSRERLESKLWMAVMGSEGFGLR